MSRNSLNDIETKIENDFGNFLYDLAELNHKPLKKVEFVSPKEMYLNNIHIRERTAEKMYTRAIFELLHNI